MKTAILVGGSGYIGGFIIRHFLGQQLFDKYIVFDIRPLQGFESEIEAGKIRFQMADVREPLPVPTEHIDPHQSWILNLAAIHREPGHEFQEYFDTNIPGAENVNAFARQLGISNLFFTSSIAPYGRSLHERTEASTLYPETGYGISKALAEQIHQKWLHEEKDRRLIIVRPSVIYGPEDPGNIYRMIRAIKKGTFVLPNGGAIIKAYGYVFGLVESISFAMAKEERLITYNYAERDLLPLVELTRQVKEEFGYSRPVVKLPVGILSMLAVVYRMGSKLLGRKTDIHPTRVKKAGFPTHIKPEYLIKSGFDFKYDFRSSLQHWRSVSPKDFE